MEDCSTALNGQHADDSVDRSVDRAVREEPAMADGFGEGLDEDAPSSEFESVKRRLEQIVEEVGDESISLDAALDLYEEAIRLGTKATELLDEQTS